MPSRTSCRSSAATWTWSRTVAASSLYGGRHGQCRGGSDQRRHRCPRRYPRSGIEAAVLLVPPPPVLLRFLHRRGPSRCGGGATMTAAPAADGTSPSEEALVLPYLRRYGLGDVATHLLEAIARDKDKKQRRVADGRGGGAKKGRRGESSCGKDDEDASGGGVGDRGTFRVVGRTSFSASPGKYPRTRGKSDKGSRRRAARPSTWPVGPTKRAAPVRRSDEKEGGARRSTGGGEGIDRRGRTNDRRDNEDFPFRWS